MRAVLGDKIASKSLVLPGFPTIGADVRSLGKMAEAGFRFDCGVIGILEHSLNCDAVEQGVLFRAEGEQVLRVVAASAVLGRQSNS